MGNLIGLIVPLEGGGFVWPAGIDFAVERPGVESFASRPLFPGAGIDWLDNSVAQAFLGLLIALAFWFIVAHNQKIVPGKRQFVGEFLYSMLRNTIARDILGPDFRRFLPYLVAMFTFILVNNWFGELFIFMFPTFSRIGFPYALALLTWIIYNAVGIQKFGPLGYLKKTTLPAGVPPALWVLIIPLEFLSNVIVRPVTLALRLFANMFGGHLVVLVFVLGGTYLIQLGIPYAFAGGASLLLSFAILGLEVFIGALQAYIFTVLTAQYIASALADEH